MVLMTPEILERKRPGRGSEGHLRKLYGSTLSDELARRGFEAKPGEGLCLDTLGDGQWKGVLFLGMPSRNEREPRRGIMFQEMGRKIFSASKEHSYSSVLLDSDLIENSADLEAVVEGVDLASYQFDRYRTKAQERPVRGLDILSITGSVRLREKTLQRLLAMNEGVRLARDLCNTPASDCTPSILISAAENVAKAGGLRIKVFKETDLRKMGAGGLLSVSRGSAEGAALVRLTWTPGGRATRRRIALIGKGVTFDSGGISIKPSAGLDEMKLDMAGAAAVLGAMQALAALKPSVEVRAYLPLTENMVDGMSTKPGDVITTMSGRTVEVVNTDAEGRLILADAICMAEKDGCDEVIDVATLTGAAVVALGVDCAALFSPDDRIAALLLEASSASREYLWRMPLIQEYREQLKSRVADLKNIGDRSLGGGSITGALFLGEFVEKASWAHLDIAGPALRTSVGKEGAPGASGYGVRTLVRYVQQRARGSA